MRRLVKNPDDLEADHEEHGHPGFVEFDDSVIRGGNEAAEMRGSRLRIRTRNVDANADLIG